MTDPAISVRNVSVAFGGRAILKNVSFDVPRGTTLAVMGLSGVGKSTTLRCLVGLQKPDSGEIYINGKNILKMDDKEFDKMRRRIGMVFQMPALFDSLTIGENVAFGLREHTKLPEEEIQRIVAEKLAIVDLAGMAGLYPNQLSGGMQKRASLARTIAIDPDVILYDEPTTGLDPILSMVINELICDLQKRLNATSVVVTHDIRGAMLVGHRIAMLHKGEFVWMGTSEEFRTSNNEIVAQFREGRVNGPIRV
ncbi:MAG: ABC transporter ATP-binding protein [bacterium]|nr:ABC transporter ATP-binding protein [bacterium]